MMALSGATSAVMLMTAPVGASYAGDCGYALPGAKLSLVASNQARQCGVAWIDSQVPRLEKLRKNWDGYGAPAIKVAQLNLLSSILSSTLPKGAPAGSIVPAADGSLQAEWHLRHASFGLVLEEGQPVTVWYQRRGGGDEIERTGIEAMSLLQYAALQSMA